MTHALHRSLCVRVPLSELEDQPWFPAALRRAITAYLRLVVKLTRQVRPVVPALAAMLDRTGESRILDLCSGSGAVAGEIASRLAAGGRTTRITLSDLYPDVESMRAVAQESGGLLDVHPRPLDATDVPDEMPGLRTMFNAFHHFDPPAARAILAAAARSRRPVAIIEFLEQTPFSLLGVLFSPLLVFALAPLLRPLRWQTLALTYLVPVIPLVVLWDGVASWARLYSVRELEELAASTSATGYRWQAGRWRIGPVHVTYLLGQPVERQTVGQAA